MRRGQNFKIVFGFKSEKAVLTFSLKYFLSPPLLNCFSCLIVSFSGHLIAFISMGKVFGKAFTILGLDERKGSWVVEQ